MTCYLFHLLSELIFKKNLFFWRSKLFCLRAVPSRRQAIFEKLWSCVPLKVHQYTINVVTVHIVSEIKQSDYAELQDVYEKLMENRSTINFENFQDVYKRLLSVQRDGKTILFHAYQVG